MRKLERNSAFHNEAGERGREVGRTENRGNGKFGTMK